MLVSHTNRQKCFISSRPRRAAADSPAAAETTQPTQSRSIAPHHHLHPTAPRLKPAIKPLLEQREGGGEENEAEKGAEREGMSSRRLKKKKTHTQAVQKNGQTNCDISIFNVFVAGDRSTPEHKRRDTRKKGEGGEISTQ